MPVVVRQSVLTRPPRDLPGFAIRPAILPAAIALVEESLIVPLELVVQDDATDPPALVPEALLRTLVGAIDLGVVRQLARFPETGAEGLVGLVFAVMTFEAVGLEEIPPALGQDDGPVLRAERARSNQSSFFEMPGASTPLARIVDQIVEIGLGHDSKRADRPQHAAFAAIDLVDPIALSNRPALTSARQVDVLVSTSRGSRSSFRSRSLLPPRPLRLRSHEPSRSRLSLPRGSYLSHIATSFQPTRGRLNAIEWLLQRMCARAIAAAHARSRSAA